MKKPFFIILTVIVGCLFFTGCGSPKKQGEKLGMEYCDCQKEQVKEQETVYQVFLMKFDSYGFKTRPEARQKLQDLQNEATQKFEECKKKVEEKVKKAKSAFPTSTDDLLGDLSNAMKNPQKYAKEMAKKQKEFSKNQEKAREFEDALRNAINQCDVPKIEIDNSTIEQIIREKISPQKPDVTNLRQNLVRRRIIEQPDGYFGRGWAWQINSAEEIKNITIEKEEKVGNDYELDVHLSLQRDQSAQYEAYLTLTCVLGQADDEWKVDFIKTKDINIVKTDRYDSCITTEIKKSWGTSLQFTNSCDVALIVGGKIMGNNNEWIKFSTRVNANGVGSASYNGKEYEIDFIERQ